MARRRVWACVRVSCQSLSSGAVLSLALHFPYALFWLFPVRPHNKQSDSPTRSLVAREAISGSSPSSRTHPAHGAEEEPLGISAVMVKLWRLHRGPWAICSAEITAGHSVVDRRTVCVRGAIVWQTGETLPSALAWCGRHRLGLRDKEKQRRTGRSRGTGLCVVC